MKKVILFIIATIVSLPVFSQNFNALMDQGRSLQNNRPEEAIRSFISAGLVDRNSLSNWEQVLAELNRTYPIIQQTRTDLGTRTDERDRYRNQFGICRTTLALTRDTLRDTREDLRIRTRERDRYRNQLGICRTTLALTRDTLRDTREDLRIRTHERDTTRTDLQTRTEERNRYKTERDRYRARVEELERIFNDPPNRR